MHAPGLLARLEPIARARTPGAEPAHDFLHVTRVVGAARAIARGEAADGRTVTVAVAAALLHELFNYPKGHPESHRSGEVCAEHAREVLRSVDASPDDTDAITYAIRVHPFSLGIAPDTLAAKILQDADRLDSIGAVGVARCFATCQAMGRPFYAEDDPMCEARAPDDKAFGLDHFAKKLLRIEAGLHTATARAMGAERTRFMRAFLDRFAAEIDPLRG